MDIVAVDIGGTNARFAIASTDAAGHITLSDPVILDPHVHASFEAAWAHYADLHATQGKGDLPAAAAIAMAGPVGGEVIKFTNNPWVIHSAQLASRLQVEALTLVNDFGAMGHAAARAHDDDFVHIAGPDTPLPRSGTISIVGPGTGLGVAHVWRDQDAGFYHVQSTEGGHIDYAPLDDFEDALLARLRKRHRRVSAERVASGPGIVDIYETLATREGRAIVLSDDAAIWTRAATGEDDLAVTAVERFCLSLGSVVGDLALAHGATGVVLAGGVAQKLGLDRLAASGFAGRFCAKGRFEALMSSIPVKLITHKQHSL